MSDTKRLVTLAKLLGDRGSSIETLSDIRQFADDLLDGRVDDVIPPMSKEEITRLKSQAALVGELVEALEVSLSLLGGCHEANYKTPLHPKAKEARKTLAKAHEVMGD